MKKNKDRITDILQSFSEIHKFDYDSNPLPYIPFGGISGTVQDSVFNIYVFRSESEVHGRYHTVFAISNYDILPQGFCIEYNGGLSSKGKPFNDQISILSYDSEIVNKTLNKRIESQLVNLFDKIDRLDTSIFKTRSTLRISEDGISLTVDWLFQKVDELNMTYSVVVKLLMDLEEVFINNF